VVSVAAFAPSTVDFGSVALGTSQSLPVAVTLDAGFALSGLTSSDGAFSAPWHLDTSDCGPTSDAACTLQIGFSGAGLGGHTAHFSVFECPIAGGACPVSLPVALPISVVSVAAFAP